MEDSIDTRYLCATATTPMNANWPSSSDHSKMSSRVPDDSPPSDTESEVCGGTPELRSSRRIGEFERMSPEYFEESVSALSSQAVPSAPVDISISTRNVSARDAKIPIRRYATVRLDKSKCWQQSERKFNFRKESLTYVARGKNGAHQFDTIRDASHEYDTLHGEKCRHKLLGAEERMVPSHDVEVNCGPSPQSDDYRLVPQGKTHIADSITNLQSLEADRYFKITFSEVSLYNESLASELGCIGSHCDLSECLTRKIEYVVQETGSSTLLSLLPQDQNQHQPRMVDVAVQTEPVEDPCIDIRSNRCLGALNLIEISPKRVAEYNEQVPSSVGPNDTSQLVETSVGVIASDGFQDAASAACEGNDLPSPTFKWNDRKHPRSEASPASNKRRARLRLGLSKRAHPPPLLPIRHTNFNEL